jgi:hypothetical protein
VLEKRNANSSGTLYPFALTRMPPSDISVAMQYRAAPPGETMVARRSTPWRGAWRLSLGMMMQQLLIGNDRK